MNHFEWLREQADIAEGDGCPEEAAKLRECADEIRHLRSVIQSWKGWHRELSDLLGCKFIERTVTMNAVRKLRAIVDKLPTTADGVPVVPGLRVHSPYDSGRTVTGFDTRRGELRCLYFDDGFDMCVWCKYSTREAAEKARDESCPEPAETT